MNQTPTIGRIVMYNTNDTDRQRLSQSPNYGNASEKLPAVITAVWSDTLINVKVIGDAPVDLWKTSINLRDEHNVEGTWEWPAIAGRPSGGGGHSAN